MKKVITYQNVYTGEITTICAKCAKTDLVGDVQVQHGRHSGHCDICQPQPIENDE